ERIECLSRFLESVRLGEMMREGCSPDAERRVFVFEPLHRRFELAAAALQHPERKHLPPEEQQRVVPVGASLAEVERKLRVAVDVVETAVEHALGRAQNVW